MEEAMVKFLIQKLESLPFQVTETFLGHEDQIARLTGTFKEITSFTEVVSRIDGDAAILSWATELRDLIFDLENNIDEFMIQMDQQSVSDKRVLNDGFRAQLQNIEGRLLQNVQRMHDIKLPTANEGDKEENIINSEVMAEGNASSSFPFKSSFISLPYYLKYCLMYCCIFPENYWISRGRLIRLLLAEGLVQEKAGEVMEDVAREYIKQLVNKGMLQVKEEEGDGGMKLKVPFMHREFLVSENIFTIINADSSLPKPTRRISIYTDIEKLAFNLKDLQPRSLFFFENQGPSDGNWLDFQWAKFLRVLDLEESGIKSLPDEIGDLIHMTYLGLKGTDINELPPTVGNLQYIQTLDIRRCRIAELSAEVLKLGRLRHLKMFKTDVVGGIKPPPGLGEWKNLLTLTGIHPGDTVATELSELIQLRRLGVMNVAEENANELFASIMKMQSLLSLSLEAKHSFDGQRLVLLESFSPPSFLRKLRLEGQLEKIPSWFGLMDKLTNLRLGFSHLSENPASVLQLLPNLRKLTLWQAYDAKQLGKEFCRAGGFPKLEFLMIASDVLEEWTELEEGALPSLQYLHLHSCVKLRMLPEGLQNVTTLKTLNLLPLLDDHLERLKLDGGEENYKIKHIQSISVLPMSVLNSLWSDPESPCTQQGMVDED
ncbi:disease resistance protein RPM1-like [Tripterygium wilfordii]|uniref:disease resistance protein RPM1-like n=1 Tax=Tripterygium wilfordii TaxID=458696 RepID=UPI0018F8358B|nr:disease resistance protein RPM1-like [Tripterygium wilfordii]